MQDDAGSSVGITADWYRLKSWIRKKYRALPKTDLWLWPILEVTFIAVFSLAPLPITAASKALRSTADVYWMDELNRLLSGGQLMYYALGFVATATWMLLIDIRRPKIVMPFLGLLVLFVVIGVAITIGVDPLAEGFNRNAFRSASYWVFFGGLLAYLATTVLKAWQPSLNVEKQNKTGEANFIAELDKELGS